MTAARIVTQFSRNRLGGEPVPDDVKVLLANHDEFRDRTGIELDWAANWAPWFDTSYLSAADRANPDISANVKAIAEVCALIAFAGADEDGNYFGYWRGPARRPVAECPLVRLDNEGQFDLLAGTTLAGAALVSASFDNKQFRELRNWLRSIGIPIDWNKPADAPYPEDADPPNELRSTIYYRHLGKKPPR